MSKRIFMGVFLVLVAITMIAPFLVMIFISLSKEGQISYTDASGIIQNLSFSNYFHVTNTIPVIKYFWNSLIVSVFTTIGQIIVSTLAGYAFARISFKYRNLLFFLILITMFVPPQVNIIPLF